MLPRHIVVAECRGSEYGKPKMMRLSDVDTNKRTLCGKSGYCVIYKTSYNNIVYESSLFVNISTLWEKMIIQPEIKNLWIKKHSSILDIAKLDKVVVPRMFIFHFTFRQREFKVISTRMPTPTQLMASITMSIHGNPCGPMTQSCMPS